MADERSASEEASPAQLPADLNKAPLAYENPAFLNSPDGRIIRILAEYSEPLSLFRRERIQDTVVFFGSARFRPLDEATLLQAAAERFKQVHGVLWRPGAHKPDHRHRRLLRTRGERPCGCGPAKERDEISSSHMPAPFGGKPTT